MTVGFLEIMLWLPCPQRWHWSQRLVIWIIHIKTFYRSGIIFIVSVVLNFLFLSHLTVANLESLQFLLVFRPSWLTRSSWHWWLTRSSSESTFFFRRIWLLHMPLLQLLPVVSPAVGCPLMTDLKFFRAFCIEMQNPLDGGSSGNEASCAVAPSSSSPLIHPSSLAANRGPATFRWSRTSWRNVEGGCWPILVRVCVSLSNTISLYIREFSWPVCVPFCFS